MSSIFATTILMAAEKNGIIAQSARYLRKPEMNCCFSFLLLSVLLLGPISSLEPAEDIRQLSFYHTHTSEELSVTYYVDGDYVAAALSDLNHFLRDFRTGEETEMDPGIYDILFDMQQSAGSTGAYRVISAYRSPTTNELLRSKSGGVARNSQHLLGKAIDVRLTDLDTAKLRDVALELNRGGVGYYRKSDFVHVDTGRVRRW